MKTFSFVLLVGLVICSGFSSSWAGSESEKAAVATARSWLALVDEGSYAGSWKEASSYLQGAVKEESWQASMEGFRKPLGKLVGRKIKKAQESSSLPGAPDGMYVVMLFETSFEKKKSAVETVTFMLEKDGKWKAAGYFIK